MTYDFRKMDECDVFKAKLSHIVINFGFIPVWRIGQFVKFCKKHGLLYHPPTYFDSAYEVKHNFLYVRTFSKISHLPLGNLVLWVSDYFYPRGKPYMKYTYRESCLVKPKGTQSGFTYVIVTTNQGISL